ncbi:MAG: class I SAM-dependent methyltransferase [Chloroflexia bacterium]|nr:class I SAM-dependent methyltransferase [Chloroflexia bacterium]
MAHEHSDEADEDARFFERYYAEAGEDIDAIPWSNLKPHPLLTRWLSGDEAPRIPTSALVIASGLGDDAEELARRGWPVVAFDAAPSAIAWCRRRFPDSPVDYRVANLFAIPWSWRHAFDVVVENRTIQSLPPARHDAVIAAIAACVAPGGEVVAIAHGRDDDEPPRDRPWPLSRRELDGFLAQGLVSRSFHDDRSRGHRGPRLFRAVYRRPG